MLFKKAASPVVSSYATTGVIALSANIIQHKAYFFHKFSCVAHSTVIIG